MMPVNKYALFCSKSDWFQYLFKSCNQSDYFFITDNGISPLMKNRFGSLFCRIVFSERIKKYLSFPLFIKKVCYHFATKKISLSKGQKIIMVFTDRNRLAYDVDFFAFCRTKFSNVVLVRWYLDLIEIASLPEKEELDFCKHNFDKVITYDPKEAIKYGFSYIETPYSKDKTIIETKVIYDVVFVGTAKIFRDSGVRLKKIIQVFSFLKEHQCRLKFYIFGVPKEFQVFPDEIVYNHYLSYHDVLELNMQSNCILEVQQEKEEGTTLRIFESIAYKKKLLIDNPEIKNNALFNPKHMYIFDEPDSIDIGFVKSRENIITESEEAIHPNHFLNQIDRLIEE